MQFRWWGIEWADKAGLEWQHWQPWSAASFHNHYIPNIFHNLNATSRIHLLNWPRQPETANLSTPAQLRQTISDSPTYKNRNKNKSQKQEHFRHRSWNPRLLVPMSGYWPSKTLRGAYKKLCLNILTSLTFRRLWHRTCRHFNLANHFHKRIKNVAQPRRAETKFRLSYFLSAPPSVFDGEYPLIGTKSRGFQLRSRKYSCF